MRMLQVIPIPVGMAVSLSNIVGSERTQDRRMCYSMGRGSQKVCSLLLTSHESQTAVGRI